MFIYHWNNVVETGRRAHPFYHHNARSLKASSMPVPCQAPACIKSGRPALHLTLVTLHRVAPIPFIALFIVKERGKALFS